MVVYRGDNVEFQKGYTVGEVAKMLDKHVETIRRYIREHRLIAGKSSNKQGYVILQENLDKFLDNAHFIKTGGKVGMPTYQFVVVSDGKVIGTFDSIENAMLMAQAFFERYYAEPNLSLTIVREPAKL